MTLPSWVPAFDASLSQVERPVTFTFATISASGMPRARTCVFRSWLFNDSTTGVLLFTTDKRSGKMSDLQTHDGRFEACFNFTSKRQQFRLTGFAQPLTATQYPSMETSHPLTPELGSPTSATSAAIATPSASGSVAASALTIALEDESKHNDSELSKSNTSQQIPFSPLSSYPVISPSIDISSQHNNAHTPTDEEWKAEYFRVWNLLRPETKAAFRKPAPRTIMTDQERKLLDSISRGVDGASESSGLDNFVVIAMFVNWVDHLSDHHNRRFIYSRVEDFDWQEHEVCP